MFVFRLRVIGGFSLKLQPRQEVETPLSSEVQWRPHRGNTGLIVPTPSSPSPPPSPADSPSARIVSREMRLCSGRQQHHNQTSETLKDSHRLQVSMSTEEKHTCGFRRSITSETTSPLISSVFMCEDFNSSILTNNRFSF